MPDETQGRRQTTAEERLRSGILRLYLRTAGSSESDSLVRDAQTWIDLEQAALPEMNSFEFFDKKTHQPRTAGSVLADAMGIVWVADRPSLTIGECIREVCSLIAAQYRIEPIDRRRGSRASLGIDVVG